MPLNEEELFSREADGSVNKDYCKWCYADGKPDDERRAMYDGWLSQLKHWKQA